MIRYVLPAILLAACGSDRYSEDTRQPPPVVQPGPNNPGGGSSGKTTFAEIQQLNQTYCVSCHANSAFINGGENGLKNSSAKQRVRNGSMPPPNASRRMSDEDRAKYLDFFS